MYCKLGLCLKSSIKTVGFSCCTKYVVFEFFKDCNLLIIGVWIWALDIYIPKHWLGKTLCARLGMWSWYFGISFLIQSLQHCLLVNMESVTRYSKKTSQKSRIQPQLLMGRPKGLMQLGLGMQCCTQPGSQWIHSSHSSLCVCAHLCTCLQALLFNFLKAEGVPACTAWAKGFILSCWKSFDSHSSGWLPLPRKNHLWTNTASTLNWHNFFFYQLYVN